MVGKFTLSVLVLALAGCGAATTQQKSSANLAPILSTQSIPAAMQGIEAKKLFGAKARASKQAATPFGSYAKGCFAGGVPLVETGPTWQAMRLSRNRNWGHPETIDFIKKLSAKAAKQPGWEGLYIGDISQHRRGPMLTGH